MKQILHLLLISLGLCACIDQKATNKSSLEINVETINFCQKEVGTSSTWNHLQLRNTSSDNLEITGIHLRGDQNCAFQCAFKLPSTNGATAAGFKNCPQEGASWPFDSIQLLPEQTLLVQVDYTPTAVDVTDNAALVITTDAANIGPKEALLKTVVIPMCGGGISMPSEDILMSTDNQFSDAGPDGSVETPIASPDAGVSYSCPECASLKKGAPGCSQSQ